MGEFKLFFEARQEYIDKIQDAVDKVSDRPFNELFQGKGDRFLIRVYNPTIEKTTKELGLDSKEFDWNKRTYRGHNLNTFIKRLRKPEVLLQLYNKYNRGGWEPDDYDGMLNDLNTQYDRAIQGDHILYKINKEISALKQAIDQNNIYYYLLFSRHPIDVLRMSDHKGISSCHRLKGEYSAKEGEYSQCALADAQNDGGVVYLIKGADVKKIKENLNDKDVFYDKDRNTGKIQPIGRIRLRRFIDLSNGKDFAVPTMLHHEQKYGLITPEIYQKILEYTREHQAIFKSPPEYTYAMNNIVLVGGTYSDEDLNDLLDNFFGKEEYANIKHKTGHITSWQEEIDNIFKTKYNFPNPKFELHAQIQQNNVMGNRILCRVFSKMNVPFQKQWNETNKFSENLDRVLDDMNHNLTVFNLVLKKYISAESYSKTEKNTWDNGILSTDISFSVDDPDKLQSVTYPLRQANHNHDLITKDIQYQINRYMMAMVEDQKED